MCLNKKRFGILALDETLTDSQDIQYLQKHWNPSLAAELTVVEAKEQKKLVFTFNHGYFDLTSSIQLMDHYLHVLDAIRN